MFKAEAIKAVFDKYEIPRILWYVDYPEKPHWGKPFGPNEFKMALPDLYKQETALLYLHLPYCHTQCYFCNCKTIISLDYKQVENYLEYLYREIDLHADFCIQNGITPNFTEMHFGGGSPTYLNEKDFNKLINCLKFLVNFEKLQEFSLEIDPRRIHPDRLDFYSAMGVNRISFGVQDLDIKVQQSINRVQPDSLIRRLLVPEKRSLFSRGVNFDIMGGLPEQTSKSFKNSVEKVIALSPDRVSLLLMSIVPKYSPHQLLMPLDKVPSAYQTKMMFMETLDMFQNAGYIRTGYDHFAKPSDDVSRARSSHNMKWGYYGCTAGRYADVLGLGISSYSKLGMNHYAQNFYELDNWQRALTEGMFPIYRGHVLSADDVMRRDIIQTLRNYFSISFKDVESVYGIDFKTYFKTELIVMKGLSDDGMLEISGDGIRLTEFGMLFADFVAGCFDAYTEKK